MIILLNLNLKQTPKIELLNFNLKPQQSNNEPQEKTLKEILPYIL